MSSDKQILANCQSRIGYTFRDQELLRRCLTHSSAAETRLRSNERLEFLGDAVLGLIICQYLFESYPDEREGLLTQLKSRIVSRNTCAQVAQTLNLRPLIFVGRGLQHIPESVLAAVVESLIAGIYLDGGQEAARTFVLNSFSEELTYAQPENLQNFKSTLQELTQRDQGLTPDYVIVDETGPDHAREFVVAARIGERSFQPGSGRSKKEAEQRAARNAIDSLLQNDQQPTAAARHSDEASNQPQQQNDETDDTPNAEKVEE